MIAFVQTILDRFLCGLYALTGVAVLDYLLGTLIIGIVVVLIGELTAGLVLRINRQHLDDLDTRIAAARRLSTQALETGDRQAYRAINKEANDLFGRLFFNGFGLSAAALWPAFFALDSLQRHFAEAGLSVTLGGYRINYVLLFLVCYLVAKFLLARIKRLLTAAMLTAQAKIPNQPINQSTFSC
jgi:hypothetical protein